MLDLCDNPSFAASPDHFCSEYLTYRGKPKTEGEQTDDEDIIADLEMVKPSLDLRDLITEELVTGIPELPRGACSGDLKT